MTPTTIETLTNIAKTDPARAARFSTIFNNLGMPSSYFLPKNGECPECGRVEGSGFRHAFNCNAVN